MMVRKVDYSEVKDSFIVTFGKCGKKPRVGISPIGIWFGYGRPEVIINDRDNTVPPLGVLRWEWIKNIEISNISQDGYGLIVLTLHDFDAVMNTISAVNRIPIKSFYVRLAMDESKVIAIPAHLCFDFNENDYYSFIEVIRQNNFAELSMIGHIDESYKQTNPQKVNNFVTIALILIVTIGGIISLLSALFG